MLITLILIDISKSLMEYGQRSPSLTVEKPEYVSRARLLRQLSWQSNVAVTVSGMSRRPEQVGRMRAKASCCLNTHCSKCLRSFGSDAETSTCILIVSIQFKNHRSPHF